MKTEFTFCQELHRMERVAEMDKEINFHQSLKCGCEGTCKCEEIAKVVKEIKQEPDEEACTSPKRQHKTSDKPNKRQRYAFADNEADESSYEDVSSDESDSEYLTDRNDSEFDTDDSSLSDTDGYDLVYSSDGKDCESDTPPNSPTPPHKKRVKREIDSFDVAFQKLKHAGIQDVILRQDEEEAARAERVAKQVERIKDWDNYLSHTDSIEKLREDCSFQFKIRLEKEDEIAYLQQTLTGILEHELAKKPVSRMIKTFETVQKNYEKNLDKYDVYIKELEEKESKQKDIIEKLEAKIESYDAGRIEHCRRCKLLQFNSTEYVTSDMKESIRNLSQLINDVFSAQLKAKIPTLCLFEMMKNVIMEMYLDCECNICGEFMRKPIGQPMLKSHQLNNEVIYKKFPLQKL